VKAYAATCEVGTPERRAEDALRYLAEGFTALKLRRHNWSLDTEGYVHVTDKPGLGVELKRGDRGAVRHQRVTGPPVPRPACSRAAATRDRGARAPFS
jgi:L-alanine-DL-glutamate epimerase-like enolase superfamily enzyme